MTSVAVVLGAGGVVGGAFELGALAALEATTGWDPRRAELLVGTSAGAGVSASLRIGFSAPDLYLRIQDLPMSAEGQALGATVHDSRIELPRPPPFNPLSLLRPTAPQLVVPAFLAPGPVRPGLLAGLLPRGVVDNTPVGDRIRALLPTPWPTEPTWVVAVRARDGKRVVFGRDDVDADLGTAVQASGAVPGYFRPVDIGDHQYLDGGLFSANNVELVAGLGFDLVVVISPMTAVSNALDRGPAGLARSMPSRVLAREVTRVREKGTPVLVIQPTRPDLVLYANGYMDHDQAGPMARRAFDSARAHLDRPDVADRVEILRTASSS